MKFNFIRKGREKWLCSREFMIALVNFAAGFLVAWIMWFMTVRYMISILQS